jgi:nucleotidyltransferase/DNA polymerase involved in DNA repair
MKKRLRLLGIRQVHQLGEFSKISLIEQFGRVGAAAWELAQGRDGASLNPGKKPDVIIASVEVDPPADTSIQILHHCQMALEKPLARMKRQGKVCNELAIEIRFASGARQDSRLPFKKGTVSVSVMLDRVRAWLEGVQFPQPVTELHLLVRLGAETGERLRLWREHAGPRPELVSLAKYLATKLGFQPLKRFETADAGAVFPERRFRLVNLPGEEAKDG